MSYLMANIYDYVMRESEEACLSEWRKGLLQKAHGHVLELGAGTGVNLDHYPTTVEHLVLLEPDKHMRKQLQRKLYQHRFSTVEIAHQSAETLPFADAHFDVVVSTLVLCTVNNPETVLSEVHRVLRPGGQFLFLEHVCAHDDPKRQKWQKRLEPMWKFVAGGCHLTRDTQAAITAANLRVESIERDSIRKAIPIIRPSIRGVATKPASLN